MLIEMRIWVVRLEKFGIVRPTKKKQLSVCWICVWVENCLIHTGKNYRPLADDEEQQRMRLSGSLRDSRRVDNGSIGAYLFGFWCFI